MITKLDLDTRALQREIDSEVLNAQSDEAALRLLLAKRALPEARFVDPPPFWTNVREQFRIFLCTDDPCYAEERKAFKQRGKEATAALLGLLTGAIAAAIPGAIAIAILLPFVALLLNSALKVAAKATLATFCESLKPQ